MDTSVPINTEAIFTCMVSVSNITESLEVSWNGPATNLSTSVLQVDTLMNQAYISILRVNLTDGGLEGEYNCTASYSQCSSSTTSTSANLTILLPPSIIQNPVDVGVVNVGDSVSFNCSTTSHGNVSISWTGPPQLNLLPITTTSDSSLTSVLHLEIADVSFGGPYTCIASNEAGSVMANTTILFVRPVATSNNSLAAVGTTTLLTCNRQSQHHSIQWEKLNNDTYEIIMGESSENLLIAVIFSSEGNYRCVVNFTEFDVIQSTSVLITGMSRYRYVFIILMSVYVPAL